MNKPRTADKHSHNPLVRYFRAPGPGLAAGVWVPVFGAVVIVATVYTTYATFAAWLKWLTAVLFAYILSAILARPSWPAALRDTLLPRLPSDARALPTLVGILGTTISPYLFFWQASQEVEEERAIGRRTVSARRGATEPGLRHAPADRLPGT